MNSVSQPGRLLVINSLIIIGACVVLFSTFLGGMIAGQDMRLVLGGFILIPSFGLIALVQYCGVFRKNENMARIAGVFIFGAGGFLLFTGIAAVCEFIVNNEWAADVFLIFGIIFLLGCYGCFCGWSNFRWAKDLTIYKTTVPVNAIVLDNFGAPTNNHAFSKKFQYSLRELLFLTFIVALISTITAYVVRSTPRNYVEHVTPEEAGLSLMLPGGASDVCCARDSRCIPAIFEFTIDEKGFFEWVTSSLTSHEIDSSNNIIQPIVGALTIDRYTSWDHKANAAKQVVIANGYVCKINGKYGTYEYVFDKDSQRAYYNAHVED